jgi:hypothetical protein
VTIEFDAEFADRTSRVPQPAAMHFDIFRDQQPTDGWPDSEKTARTSQPSSSATAEAGHVPCVD